MQLPALSMGNPAGLPGLPKLPLALPQTLFKVGAIQAHPAGVPPPPPPPQIPSNILRGDVPRGEPVIARKMVEFKGKSATGAGQPRPPPKKQATNGFTPTPPAGPPPAHAYVLAKKGVATGLDESDVRRRAKHPNLTPTPPSHEPPAFLRPKAPELDAKVPTPPPPPGASSYLKKSPTPHPVPDWVRSSSEMLVYIFVGGTILESCFFIIAYGTYMEPAAIWATQAATIIGCLVNFGLFETVKCVVVACVALVRDETERRQAETDARKQRMALKAQRAQEKGRRPKYVPATASSAPPPMIG